jgi:citrate synthase
MYKIKEEGIPMTLEYAGPRPIISYTGITFKDGKEDKYVYLHYAIDILESMNEDFKNDGNYSHLVTKDNLSNEQMQNIISKYHPELQDIMKEEIKFYDQHLHEEIQLATKRSTLKTEEKNILIKNLEIMHDYRIQRAKNKIFYRHIIETISEVIKDKKIKEINTPFNEKFWHILQTISGQIAQGKHSYYSKVEIEKRKDVLLAKLSINI